MACHVLGVRSLLWHHVGVSIPTGLPRLEQLTQMVQFWPERSGARREVTLYCSTPGSGPDLWFQTVRSQGVCRTRPDVSLGC